MSNLATVPPRRPELLVRPLGDTGQSVVKDPRTGHYYNLGAHESFLLAQLDGVRTAEQVCAAFAERFDEPLSADDLNEFIDLARARGLLRYGVQPGTAEATTGAPAPAKEEAAPQADRVRRRQSILYW